MRRLVAWNVMTLDGYFEGARPWDLDMHGTVWGDELQDFSLTRIAVPMPATAGDKYHLPDAELTPEERALLDSFLPAPAPAAGR
jgi:hypothetical protein